MRELSDLGVEVEEEAGQASLNLFLLNLSVIYLDFNNSHTNLSGDFPGGGYRGRGGQRDYQHRGRGRSNF
jgi:hypothetical protein